MHGTVPGTAEGCGAPFFVDLASVTGRGAVCRETLDTVPSWFGLPEANDTYVAFVDTHDTWIAYSANREPIGFISGQLHFPETAEIEIMAMRPEWHRRGVGRALVDAFEAHHRRMGIRSRQPCADPLQTDRRAAVT